MSDLDALLAAIVADPLEETRWLVLADYLEEHNDPRRGELLRLHRKLIATCCEPAHPERAAWQSRMVELMVAGVRPCVPQETLILPGGVPMTFSFIPPGRFLMGSDRGQDCEKPIRRVEVTSGFYLGIHPVTGAQWATLTNWDPPSDRVDHATIVSWDDCQEFGTKLSELAGHAVGLPTETEWEYACRAGTTTDYHTGDGEEAWRRTACCDLSSARDFPPVGTLLPNAWGLFDTHGLIWEWCQDWLGPTTFAGEPAEPRAGEEAEQRALRGGCFADDPVCCTSSHRSWMSRWFRGSYFGARFCYRPR